MKRHALGIEGAMEAGQAAHSGSVSMVPKIQPYQAATDGRHAPSSSGSAKAKRDDWQQNVAIAAAVWFGGWVLGYGLLWPLYLGLSLLSWLFSLTPFSGLTDWFGLNGPVADTYPAASELRIPGSQVGRYIESYVQSYGDAALIFAAHDGYAQLVHGLLLSKDLGYADLVDAADESGHTALLYAAGRGFQQVAATLLQGGADPDAPKQGKDGRGLTPLMEAAGTGHRDIVTLLLKANATLDLLDEKGSTALMYAAAKGHLGALQELLQHGATRETVNRRGDTALSLASAKGFQAVVDALHRSARSADRKGKGLQAALPSTDKDRANEPPTRSKLKTELEEAEKIAKEKEDEEKAASKTAPSASWFSKGSQSLQSGPAEPPAGDSKRITELEKELAELHRSHEAAELKSHRRIVELLETSTDMQKLADEADKARKEAQQRADDLAKKLREKDASSVEDDERASRLSKEAHEARMEVERERTRADAAEREKDRKVDELKRLEATAKQRKDDAEEQAHEVERLQKRLKALRVEADHTEDERRALQSQLDRLRTHVNSDAQGSPALGPPDTEAAAKQPVEDAVSPGTADSTITEGPQDVVTQPPPEKEDV